MHARRGVDSLVQHAVASSVQLHGLRADRLGQATRLLEKYVGALESDAKARAEQQQVLAGDSTPPPTWSHSRGTLAGGA
jgi:hypothetical protein